MANVNLIVEWPVANPFKFTLDGVSSGVRADFDQRRYAQAKHATVEEGKTYQQKFENADTPRFEFYSNYPLSRTTIINCEEEPIGSPLTPTMAVSYRNKKYRSACKLSSIGGKLFIYFISGIEYSDEDFEVPGDLVVLDGRLPNIKALPGDVLRFSFDGDDFTATTIDKIRWSPTLRAQGYLADLDYTLLSPVDGFVEVTYDEKPANLFQQVMDFSALDPGKYFVRCEFGISGYNVSFTSEPIDVQEEHEDTLALEYRHVGTYDRADIWSYVYLSDWVNIVRIPADFYKFSPAGEVELDTNDSGTPRMLRAIPYRQVELNFLNMPSWLADKVQVALSHDTKIINDYEWEMENYGQFDLIDRMDLGTYTIILRQKTDRLKKVNIFTEEITAEFDPNSFAAIDWEGDVVTAEFISNTLGVFRFVSLPPWIETDVEEFTNGDIVEFTIAENDTFFDRSIQLIALSDDFDGLTATIDFEQAHDETIVEFIDVDDEDVSLGGEAGANQLINVSSSGDYDITFSGAFTFEAAKESGFTQVRITESSANNTGANRVGVVRLALQSNPTIFVDIDVIQVPLMGIISLTPPGVVVGELPDSIVVDVETLAATQWQADSPATWIHHDTFIHTGSLVGFEIFVSKKPVYVTERTGSVTFFNIANPSDSLSFIITQTDGE